MFDHPLSLPARAAVTLTSLALVLFVVRVLFRGHKSGVVLLVWFAISAAFAHVPFLVALLPRVFPIGFVIGIGSVVASLFYKPARRAFDDLDDGEMRTLLSFRAIYGALLIGLAAIGHFPIAFAISAGLGDLTVTWLAFAMPGKLSSDGPRWARVLVHGVGLADMMMVLFFAVTVVRPWSDAHGNATTSMTLPWLAVPLMFALNAHGIRKALEALGDGSQSARGVRSAVRGA